jgi:hypothetical protein
MNTKITQILIFGLKIYHLATPLESPIKESASTVRPQQSGAIKMLLLISCLCAVAVLVAVSDAASCDDVDNVYNAWAGGREGALVLAQPFGTSFLQMTNFSD